MLVVASATYRERAEGRSGPDTGRGVQWEARLIRDAFYAHSDGLDRFVPVVLSGQSAEGVPDFLAPASSTVYHVTDFSLAGADALLRLLLSQPAETVPDLGAVPVLGQRDHALTTPVLPALPVQALDGPSLRHDIALHVSPADGGGVRTETLLAGTVLGQVTASLPVGLGSWQSELDRPSGQNRLTTLGQGLWRGLLDEPTRRRLVQLIDHGPVGSVVDVVVHLAEDLSWLPVELLCLPDGRLVATMAAVRFSRMLAGVEQAATPPLAGPLKILAAVAAPDETKTTSQPLDVEAEMQALLDAVSDLDLASAGAQVRILEVASLAEIGQALAAEQYHVLHLSAHGSAHTVELEDEDGYPEAADAGELVAALKAGEKRLPLVVLSSCHGAEAGTAGLAAELVLHGADRVVAMQAAVTDRFATALAHELYRQLAASPQATVAQALAAARRVVSDRAQKESRRSGVLPRPEFAVPILLCGGPDLPLRNPALTEVPLKRSTMAASGAGVRELPLGHLIGRRAPVRTAMAVLRGNAVDRERFGDRAGVAVTGIGGIGKTAVAGRILARARDLGWMIAEHIGAWNPSSLIRSVADVLTDPHIAELLREPGRDDAAKMSLVLRILQRERLLVLFDDFEQNLTASGEFADPGFAEIFALLCGTTRAGRILVTCRYPVPDSEDALLRIDLPALSPAELSRLLLRLPALRELSAEDRRLVSRTIGGHPRLIEFLDVLLRHGTAASFRHVTGKLRGLATAENINLSPSRGVAEGVKEVVRLGSRDILLDSLIGHLTPPQRELALQAALARAPFTIQDIAHTRHGSEPDSAQLAAVTGDVERLRDLTLLSATPEDELEMHPWVASSLARHQIENDLLTRHQRGAEMRMHRINHGRGGFHDIVDLISHLAGCRNYDNVVACAMQACDLVGGEVGVSALLAEAVPLIPTDHPNYLALAERECIALQAIGLTTATSHRLHKMLAISEQRATTDPHNAKYQRDLSIGHNQLGDLAVTLGDTTTANEHYRASLDI
ncbi:CHAT domain-containing protein, partial [Lentzea californiensis]|nr:CHAT domain-containing protein [Lentzea californiensis]